ncbi:MAG: AraC family transcriptional regulator [Gammaproteobacteria bacterium]|nr:MAG: AraC family transcriptional regulator [Gammaproteobacteria bacterium]
MDTVLFNFHDLTMAFTAFECLLFSALLLLTRKHGSISTLLLTGFLICHFLIPLHELIFWGKQFRLWVLNISPNLFFWGSYAYFLDGPLLYLFFRSTVYKNFKLKSSDAYHLIPVVLYFIGMIFIYYSKDSSTKYHLVESQEIAYSATYLCFEAAGRLLRLSYALLCVYLVLGYTGQLKEEYANLRPSESLWLKIMLGSFVILFGWDLVLLIIKLEELLTATSPLADADLLSFFGIGSYYLNLIVITVLIFLRFTSFDNLVSVTELGLLDAEEKPPVSDDAIIAKLQHVMVDEKFYADPDISLDSLAKKIDLPPKKLTMLIKRNHQTNFYEFVNAFRLEEAKRLLSDNGKNQKTIMDIYLEVGFNSKSVFNTYFKRVVGVTPSQFREQVSSDVSSL